MLALTPSERRGALVLVLLLLIGAGHDLWRARGPSAGAPRGEAPRQEGARSDAAPPEPAAWDTVRAPGSVAGSGVAPESAASDKAARPGASAVRRVPIDLNRAGVGDLDGLPGVGPVLAGRIVLQRRRFGPFHEVDELLAVRGVGPRLLERIRPWATVETPPDVARAATDAVADTTTEPRR